MVPVGAKIMVDQNQEVRRMLSATTVTKEGTSRMSVGYSKRMEILKEKILSRQMLRGV